jgi:hypothetical protein
VANRRKPSATRTQVVMPEFITVNLARKTPAQNKEYERGMIERFADLENHKPSLVVLNLDTGEYREFKPTKTTSARTLAFGGSIFLGLIGLFIVPLVGAILLICAFVSFLSYREPLSAVREAMKGTSGWLILGPKRNDRPGHVIGVTH